MSPVIRHHPDGATLMGFAAGTLCEPLAAVVSAHVTLCPRCLAEVGDLERLGGALLLAVAIGDDEEPLHAPRRPADDRERAKPARPSAMRDVVLPPTIAAAYGLTLASVPWKRLGPGVWHHRLGLRGQDGGDLRLLRIAPGRTMPEHGHGGAELTLVIAGAYSDVTGEYRRGDIQDVDEGVEHSPIVSGDGECICLIASEKPARFKSLLGRLSQPWTGM